MFRTVTLPLALPGLANAFLLLFAASLADFATPLILAGNAFPVLPTEAYLQITGLFDLKGGAAMSLLLLVPAALVYFVQRTWVERGHYVTISGKAGPQSTIRSVTPAARWLLILLCLAVALLHRLSLRAAAARLAGRRVRRQPHLDARALPRDLHRRPQGDHRHA